METRHSANNFKWCIISAVAPAGARLSVGGMTYKTNHVATLKNGPWSKAEIETRIPR